MLVSTNEQSGEGAPAQASAQIVVSSPLITRGVIDASRYTLLEIRSFADRDTQRLRQRENVKALDPWIVRTP